MHAVELGEERLAVSFDRRARGAESLPELVALVLGKARAVLLLRLPAGEERVELGGDLLPLRLRGILRRQRLGLGDERLALHERLGRGGLRLGRLLLGQLADAAAELLEPLAQAGEIADGVGGRDGLGEVGDRLGDVLGGCAAADALLEQADLAGELGELALVVGERLLRRGVRILTDGAFAVRLTHVDRSVVTDAAPWCLFVGRHRILTLPIDSDCLWPDRPPAYCTPFGHRATRYWSVREVIVAGTSGAPDCPSAPIWAGSMPAAVICAMRFSRPLVTLPTTV